MEHVTTREPIVVMKERIWRFTDIVLADRTVAGRRIGVRIDCHVRYPSLRFGQGVLSQAPREADAEGLTGQELTGAADLIPEAPRHGTERGTRDDLRDGDPTLLDPSRLSLHCRLSASVATPAASGHRQGTSGIVENGRGVGSAR